MNQQIRKDAGGTLEFYPPQGRVTGTPTYSLLDADGTALATGLSSSVDSVNTTFSHTEAAGQTALSLTTTANITVGEWYTITNALGQSESVRVVKVDSGSAATVAEPIEHTYSAADTLEGTKLSLSVSAANAATLGTEYSAQVTYTVDGTEYIERVFYDVVISPWDKPLLSYSDVKRILGSLARPELELKRRRGLGYIDERKAAQELVRLDIMDRDLRPDLFLSAEPFKRAIAYRIVLQWAEEGRNIPSVYQDDPDAWEDKRRDIYDEHLTKALNQARVYDANEDDGISEAEATARRGSIRIYL